MTRRLPAASLALAVAAMTLPVSIGTGPATAAAVRTRTLYWRTHRSVTAGQPFTFTYRTGPAPAGTFVQLQRQMGTGHVWGKVRNYPRGRHTETAPRVGIGGWNYRVVLRTRRQILRTGAARRVLAYQDVPLSTILGRKTNTKQVGGSMYRYDWGQIVGDGYTETLLKRNSTSCRSITLSAAVTPNYGVDGVVQLTQEDADQASLAVPAGAITPTVTWRLTGHALKLSFHIADDPNGVATVWALTAATLNCWTVNAKVPGA